MKDDTLIGFDDPVGFTPDPLTEVRPWAGHTSTSQTIMSGILEPLNAQMSAHCTSATRESGAEGAESTKFAKCSSLALLSEQTLR